MKKKLFVAVLIIFSCSTANAQSFGYDMVTAEMIADGLFIPHKDWCDSGTEVFVAVGAHANRGFCLEKNLRGVGNVYWEDARQACAADGKRLPEPSEFRIACVLAPAGLNNMTTDGQWISNFAAPFGTVMNQVLTGWAAGGGSCDQSGSAIISGNNAGVPYAAGSYKFRCLR